MRVRVPLQWKLLVMLVGLVVAVSAATVAAWIYALTQSGAAEHLNDPAGRHFMELVVLNAFLWTCVVAMMAGIYVRRITLPLSRIAEAAAAVEAGHYDVVVDVPEGDEMETFTHQFNQLVRSLRGQRDHIQELIAELNKANQTLTSDIRRSERLAALGTLSAGLAHELNNLLNNIHGYTRILQKEIGEGPPIAADLKIMARECRRASELIQRYLMFARPARLECQLVALDSILDSCFTVLELPMRTQDIKLVRTLQNGLPLVECDPLLIEQAVFNVLLNAIQAMKSGGTLTIEACAGEDGHLTLRIMDTGCGIGRDSIAKVFDPFFSTKGPGEGTGLGLAITHRIIEQHDGRVRLESEPGRGTCVTIDIPTQRAVPPHPREETA